MINITPKIICEIKSDIERCKNHTSKNGSKKLYDEMIAKYSVIDENFSKDIQSEGKIAAVGQEFDFRPELFKIAEKLEMILLISEDTDVVTPSERIEKILHRFRIIASQLEHRHNKINTLIINDEYDVQDLLHALFKVDFDDVRAEEWTPSYAGGSARMDFLIMDIDTVVEVKMTRNSMTPKSLGEELIIDIQKYQKHPNCKRLYCFVYDPNMRLGNPVGLKTDLESSYEGFLRVVITQ